MNIKSKGPVFSLDELVDKLLELAYQASVDAEVPAASIVCEAVDQSPETGQKQYRILGAAANGICRRTDPTAHSEILALRRASRQKKTERLPGCIMLSTLEPCLMCSGAVILARLHSVYYLAETEKGPGMSWIMNQICSGGPQLNHYPVLFHIQEREEEYQRLLRAFFQKRRKPTRILPARSVCF